jgi:putative ATP-binding cassette transporter
MSQLLRFFIRLSGGMAALIALASILAGACNTAMLAVLNRALEGDDGGHLLALAFVGAVTLKLVTSYVSDVMLIRFSARTLAQLRDRLALQVTEAPLRRVERLGAARIVSLLTGDIETLNVTYLALPYYGSQAAILVGGAIYLGWLSPPTLLALSIFSLVSLIGQNFAFLSLARTRSSVRGALARPFRRADRRPEAAEAQSSSEEGLFAG